MSVGVNVQKKVKVEAKADVRMICQCEHAKRLPDVFTAAQNMSIEALAALLCSCLIHCHRPV